MNRFKKFFVLMIMHRFTYFVLILSFLTRFQILKCENACSLDKIEIPVHPISRIVLRYKCFAGNDTNPPIPIDFGKFRVLFF